MNLRTDASNDTISGVLETKDGRPVFFCSKLLRKAEKNWNIVEKEAFAIYHCILRLRYFLLGRRFVVFSDHKPLEYLFNSEKSAPTVLRWKLQLQEFAFTVHYCSGKNNTVADCLSRITSLDFEPSDILVSDSEIIKCQSYDDEIQAFITTLNSNNNRKPDCVREATWRMRNELKVCNNVLKSHNERSFIPYRLRLKVLNVAHGIHHGINQTIERLKGRFIWPNLKILLLRLLKIVVLVL